MSLIVEVSTGSTRKLLFHTTANSQLPHPMARWNTQTTHSDIGDFSDNPHLRKELKKRRMKIAAIIVSVTLVLGLSAMPVYRAFRNSMIEHNLEAAKQAARLEDWGLARDKARSVLLARPSDFEAYRIWTRALGKIGEHRTYMAAVTLFMDSRATREDKLESLQVMALQAPHAVALSAYSSLPLELRNQALFRAAITPLLVYRGDVAEAEKGLREVMQASDPPAVRLELLRVLCAQPSPERVLEARGIFAELISSNANHEALAALLILGESPGGLAQGNPLPDLQAWLKKQAKATVLHHLLGMHPALEAQPERANRLYDSAIERFLAIEPGVLGTWLVRHGQAERAAVLLEEPAKTRADAYISRLNALLRLEREDEITTMLKKAPDSADMVEVEIVHAALAKRRRDPMAASAAWTRSLNSAAFDQTRNRFIEIGRIAETFKDEGAVIDSWVAAVRSGWGRLPLYRDLGGVFGVLATNGRSEDLLAMYRTLLRFEPYNAELSNNYCYLALIHGLLAPDKAARAMAELIEGNPKTPEFYSALMLAKVMDGRPADALSLLPKLRESRRVAPMMMDAIEGSARLLVGETKIGTSLIRKVNWRAFMRQERVAFRKILVKLEIAGLPLPEPERPETNADSAELPAWRKTIERFEKERAGDILPALPIPRLPALNPSPSPTGEN